MPVFGVEGHAGVGPRARGCPCSLHGVLRRGGQGTWMPVFSVECRAGVEGRGCPCLVWSASSYTHLVQRLQQPPTGKGSGVLLG